MPRRVGRRDVFARRARQVCRARFNFQQPSRRTSVQRCPCRAIAMNTGINQATYARERLIGLVVRFIRTRIEHRFGRPALRGISWNG